MTFTPPASTAGDYVKIADLNGHLCIFTPLESLASVATVNGDSPAVRVNIVDLDADTEHNDVLVFNKAIVSSLKSNIGAQVLARVGQGIAKPGKTAPWILNDATTDKAAVAKATAYIAKVATAGITSPAPQSDGLAPEALGALSNLVDVSDPAIAAALAQLAKK